MQAENVMEGSREKYRSVGTLPSHLTCKKVMWGCTACQYYGQNNQRTSDLLPVMTWTFPFTTTSTLLWNSTCLLPN